MRITIGIVGVLGLGASVTAALGQGPGTGQRGAMLLPPQRADATEVIVARGSADDLPPFPGSTPVRPMQQAASGPGWLNGTDTNVRPAGAIIAGKQQLATSDVGQDTDRSKTPVSGKVDPRTQANANTPFRGTTANGAPVYAGPPAYRWYGWGTVTPGANPYAPTGRYPNASANWYAITGATPGAFPVPVMNPLRPPPGTEPPAYVATPAPRVPVSNYVYTPPTATVPPAPIAVAPSVPDLSRFAPPENKLPSAPPIPTNTAPISTAPTIPFPVPPSMSEQPKPANPIVAPPIPTLPPATVMPLVPPIDLEKEPVGVKEPEPVGPRVAVNAPFAPTPSLPRLPDPLGPPALPALPIVPPVSGEAVGTVVPDARSQDPAPLPVSVITTEEQPKWQPGTTKLTTGEWNSPGTTSQPAGAAPQSAAPAPKWEQSRGTERTQPVARGQVGDNRPDPAATLIRKVCEGRADAVDVRWVGTKKLTVCFECRTTADAQKLVKDVSARPELAPFQIDFCVFVK
jgi:hypothetical protein